LETASATVALCEDRTESAATTDAK